MKSAKLWLGLVVAGGLLSGAAWGKGAPKAVDTVVGGVTWSYAVVDETASVMGANPAVGTLTIPSVLDGYPVTGVGYKAFGSCEGLTGVVFPVGLTSIGDRAFQYCTALDEVTIPAGVTNIGAMAFQYCASLKTVELPQNLENIGANAFYRCDALSKLHAPALWVGTSKVWAAGVGSGCTVVYGEAGVETLVFNANGGSCETVMRGYPLGAAYGWLPEATAPDNRQFAGWWTEARGGSRITETDTASVEGVRRIYAHWTPLLQTVTFEANGGNCVTTTAVFTVGGTYSPLPTPTREHYDFVGWFTTWGTPILEGTEVTTDEEWCLCAYWTQIEQEVRFDANEGICGTSVAVYAYGGTYAPLPLPTREHYAFAGWWGEGWNMDGDWVEIQVTESTAVSTDSTRWLNAHWTRAEQVVTFNANGGSCDTTDSAYAIGGTYKSLPTATREHYDFDGWFTDANGGDRLSGLSVVTSEETRTLYAHWTAAKQVVTFINTYGGIGEDLSYSYPIGEPYGWLPEPTREGCVFDGWRTENGEDVDPTSLVATNETLTLYAGWWGYTVSNSESLVTFFGLPRSPLVIPAELGGLPVTGIASNAFRDCSHLLSVEIPADVTSIGENAFSGCYGLTAVHIHDLAAWSGISFGNSFANPLSFAHHLYLDGAEQEGDLIIPDGAVRIGSYAFYGFTNLTSVTIPDSVTSIGDGAFSGCSALMSVTIPNSVTSIGDYAFGACWDLTSVTIPGSVTSIGEGAFSGCSGLTSVTIPDGVTGIGEYAFYGCSDLTRMTIPDSVTSIGESAFSWCSSLTSVTIGNGVTYIGWNAFGDCNGLTAVHIHDLAAWAGISFAGSSANPFSYAHHLYWDGEEQVGDLIIPDGAARIGSYAFYGFTNLTSVTIPDGATSIGSYAFYGCTNLTSVTIPDGVTGIGEYAFYGCSDLTRMTIPDGVTYIGYQTFYGCSGLTSVTIPDSVWSIGQQAFCDCSGLTSVTIPESVESIGYQTFYGCWGLKTLYVPAAWESLYYEDYNTGYWQRLWRNYASVPSDCTVVYAPPTSQETKFDAMGGRCAVLSRMHAVGEAYGALPEATRERYAFGGWWTDRIGGKLVTGESLVSANSLLWLYAHWSLADEGYAAWLAERGEAESSLPVEGDADGDGMTNWEEYVAGTDPRDGTERLEARIRWVDGKPEVETSVAVPKGRTVRVEGKKSLVGEEEWTDVTGRESNWAKEGWRFFRVGVALE